MSSIKSIESLDIHESSPRPPFQDGEPAGVAAKQLYMANRAPSKEQEPETSMIRPSILMFRSMPKVRQVLKIGKWKSRKPN